MAGTFAGNRPCFKGLAPKIRNGHCKIGIITIKSLEAKISGHGLVNPAKWRRMGFIIIGRLCEWYNHR